MRPGREAILRAARDVHGRSGPQALTMREVGARCGISAAAIYHHFTDRDELLREVLRVGFDRFRSYLARGSRGAEGAGPRERLLAVAEGYVDFALDHPSDYEAMFGRPELLPKNAYPEGFRDPRGQDTPFLRLLETLRGLRWQGSITSDPEETALLMWSVLHGLIMLFLARHIELPPGEFRGLCLRQASRIVELLFDRPGPPRRKDDG